MKVRIFTFIVAAVVGLLGGYLFRSVGKAAGETGEPRRGRPVVEASGDRGGSRLRSAAVVGKKDRKQAKLDLVDSSGVVRWLHWVGALESGTLDDMERLIPFTKGNPMAEQMLLARWMELGPQHFFETVADASGGSIEAQLRWQMLNEWVKIDQAAVVKALRSTDAPGVDSMRMEIVGDVIENDAELGLELFHEWKIGSYRPRMGAVEKWARADPKYAAEFVLAHPVDTVTESAVELIGKIWSESDPEAAMDFAVGEQDRFRVKMAEEVLKAWAKRDFSAAADWLGES